MSGMDPQAKLFKALMHPARLEILEMLREGEECVCHMEASLGCRQAYISQQLSVLKEAGLVEDRREGWNVFYRVVKPQVFNLLEAATKITGVADLGEGRAARKRARACPCPKCNPVVEGVQG
ncbi:MAG: transcriptional regulator [Chloroflexota bacterium]|nr:MAG: transcriptional regulator [Chloroflexota bacterium]